MYVDDISEFGLHELKDLAAAVAAGSSEKIAKIKVFFGSSYELLQV